MGPFFGELSPSFSLGTSVFDLDFCDPTKNWIQDCCFIPKPRKSPCQPDSQTKGWDIGSLSSNYLTQLIILNPTILGDGSLCNLGFGYSLTNPKYIISQMNMWKFRRDTSEVVGLRCVLIKLYESCLFAVNLDRKRALLNCWIFLSWCNHLLQNQVSFKPWGAKQDWSLFWLASTVSISLEANHSLVSKQSNSWKTNYPPED